MTLRSRIDVPPPPQAKRRWKVASVSVPGTSHQAGALPCQDRCGSFTAGDVIWIAIADGAGTAIKSEQGSAIAIRVALLSIFHNHLDCGDLRNPSLAEKILRNALAEAKKAVDEYALHSGLKPTDLATTLSVVLGCPDFAAAAQIGDGATIIGDHDSNLITLTAPRSQEYVNETTFLSSPDALETIQFNSICIPLANLAALTDGLQILALQNRTSIPHRPFFLPLFDHLSAVTEEEAEQGIEYLLESERVRARTDDDLTLVTAHLHAK